MQITQETVDHVAQLARLTLTPEEKARYATELSNILALVEELEELDLGKINLGLNTDEPTVFRQDNGERHFTRDELLANAPDEEEGFFKVPQILDVVEDGKKGES